jgi:hypothetical protein
MSWVRAAHGSTAKTYADVTYTKRTVGKLDQRTAAPVPAAVHISIVGRRWHTAPVSFDHRRIALVTIVAGVLLGAVDLLLQRALPYPWANLANSSAVWALAAFGLGWWLRLPWLRAAAAGVVLLVLAVPSYYLTATLVQQDDLSNAWAPSSLLWMFFGVLAGVVFGVAGAWARTDGWRRAVGTALPGAVLFAEAAIGLGRSGDGENVTTAAIKLALGVLLILVVGRTARQRLTGLAAAVPLALVGFAGFLAAGFG